VLLWEWLVDFGHASGGAKGAFSDAEGVVFRFRSLGTSFQGSFNVRWFRDISPKGLCFRFVAGLCFALVQAKGGVSEALFHSKALSSSVC